jgi:hypothetical protein
MTGTEAFDLLWRLLDLAPSIYERCDDSNGSIGGVMTDALHDLGAVSLAAKPDMPALVERVRTPGIKGATDRPVAPD